MRDSSWENPRATSIRLSRPFAQRSLSKACIRLRSTLRLECVKGRLNNLTEEPYTRVHGRQQSGHSTDTRNQRVSVEGRATPTIRPLVSTLQSQQVAKDKPTVPEECEGTMRTPPRRQDRIRLGQRESGKLLGVLLLRADYPGANLHLQAELTRSECPQLKQPLLRYVLRSSTPGAPRVIGRRTLDYGAAYRLPIAPCMNVDHFVAMYSSRCYADFGCNIEDPGHVSAAVVPNTNTVETILTRTEKLQFLFGTHASFLVEEPMIRQLSCTVRR